MAWTIKYSDIATKQIKKLDKSVSDKITHYLSNRIANAANPKAFGKPLLYEKNGLWRFRVENYRIICKIDKGELIVLVLQIGHRSTIYDE